MEIFEILAIIGLIGTFLGIVITIRYAKKNKALRRRLTQCISNKNINIQKCGR